MLDILSIISPIYALIAVGFLAVRFGPFRREDMRILGAYVLNIALPVLLFKAVASRDIAEVFHLGYMAAVAISGLITVTVAYTWFTATKARPTRRAIAVMGSSCPNSGFVGYPVMLLAFPHLAGSVLAMNMLVEVFLIIPICLIIIEASKAGNGQSTVRKAVFVSLRMARQPMMIGLILGLLVSLAGLPIPAPADRLFSVIANSASAPSLFVIGGSLAGLTLSGNRSFALQITFGKLILHPLAATGAVALVSLFSITQLGPELASIVVLSAAMPIYGIYTAFAQDINEDGIASIAQLTSTLVAFLTLSAVLSVLT